MATLVVLGMTLCLAAALILLLVVFRPVNIIPAERRRPTGNLDPSALTQFADSTVGFIEKITTSRSSSFEDAGLAIKRADFIVLVLAASTAGAGAAFLLKGIFAAVFTAVMVPAAAYMFVSWQKKRRQARFGAQLGDALALISGGLRAGHSVLRAVDAVAKESPEPTASEFARIVNETRLGRDLEDSLQDVSLRMGSEDFSWVAQAIEINREVGGDLAEVLDQVGDTIRERAQIKGTIKALAAEGKLSAIILMALPVVLFLMISMANPAYAGRLTGDPIGWVLLAAAAVMMSIGGLWIRKISDLKF